MRHVSQHNFRVRGEDMRVPSVKMGEDNTRGFGGQKWNPSRSTQIETTRILCFAPTKPTTSRKSPFPNESYTWPATIAVCSTLLGTEWQMSTAVMETPTFQTVSKTNQQKTNQQETPKYNQQRLEGVPHPNKEGRKLSNLALLGQSTKSITSTTCAPRRRHPHTHTYGMLYFHSNN